MSEKCKKILSYVCAVCSIAVISFTLFNTVAYAENIEDHAISPRIYVDDLVVYYETWCDKATGVKEYKGHRYRTYTFHNGYRVTLEKTTPLDLSPLMYEFYNWATCTTLEYETY